MGCWRSSPVGECFRAKAGSIINGSAARLVIVQYVFFADFERALGQAALSNGGFIPGLIRLPAGHEIPREMPLLLRFDISIQSVRNGHTTFPQYNLLNDR